MSSSSLTPEDAPDDSVPAGNDSDCGQSDIFAITARRAELLNRREALAKKKSELIHSTERLSMSLSHYRAQQLQYETKRKLEFYLHQNDHELNILSKPDNAASFVLKNLDVLPSTDTQLRASLMNKFYPNISISQASLFPQHEQNMHYDVIEFTLSSLDLPSLGISLKIHRETVHSLELLNSSDTVPIFHKISPSFCQTLIEDYVPSKKLGHVVYGYHSLSQLSRQRTKTLTQIISKYEESVIRPAAPFNSHAAQLTSMDVIEISIVDQVTKEHFRLKLRWNLVLESSTTAELESQLFCTLFRGANERLGNTNDLFSSLVAEYGVVSAFDLMIQNLFCQ